MEMKKEDEVLAGQVQSVPIGKKSEKDNLQS